jgi:DNA primase large subunit
MKLLIVGHGRHGKDTVSAYLKEKYTLDFLSSSEFCAENVIFPVLSEKYSYKTVQECFDDRHNHRTEWYNLIHAYNEIDHARLGREIFSKYDIYCGLRNAKEMIAMKDQHVYDHAIWVDRSEHLPSEDISSMTISKDMCDIVIDNNGTLDELYEKIDDMMKIFLTSD